MRGLDYIATMRRDGYKPAHIVLSEERYDQDDEFWVQYEVGDSPETHDLRVLVGMIVSVMGPDPAIVKRWCTAVLKAGAKTVLGCQCIGSGEKMKSVWTDYRINGVDQ